LGSDSDPEILSPDEGVAFLEASVDSSWPDFEDESAIGFRVQNYLVIFNFGPPGSFARYLGPNRPV
jgi:hypothetical protein